MSVICRKFLLKLALRTYILLNLSHASTLSLWNEEIQARVNREQRKQQHTVTLFEYNYLAHVIVLWQMQKFMCYCTVFALIYFEFEGTSQALAPKGLYLAVTIACEGN